MVRHVGRQEAIGVWKPGFVLGREYSLVHAAMGLCLHGGQPAVLGAPVHLLILYLELLPSTLLRHGGVLGGVFRVGDGVTVGAEAVRVMPAPAPTQHMGWDAKPCEIATRPHVHFSRFWDQSLWEPFRSDVRITSSKH